MRAPRRFTSDEDRECYRQAIRSLALVYVGILALVVVFTALHGEWRKQGVAAKTATSAIDIPPRP
jgi:hypothetical protein